MSRKFDWKAAVWAGLIAGVVFLILEMAMVAFIQGMSPWGPPRMMAAIAMGEGVLPPPPESGMMPTFDVGVMMVAMIVHFVITIVFGFIFAILHTLLNMSLATAIVAGTIFGLAVYYVDFYIFTAVFPWFAMARGMVSIIAHAVYGLVLGWAYHALARPRIGSGEAVAH